MLQLGEHGLRWMVVGSECSGRPMDGYVNASWIFTRLSCHFDFNFSLHIRFFLYSCLLLFNIFSRRACFEPLVLERKSHVKRCLGDQTLVRARFCASKMLLRQWNYEVCDYSTFQDS